MAERDHFVKPPTAQQAVLSELRQAIVRGELKPGTPLLQEDISRRLGVSRIPIREAFQILEGEGLLTRNSRIGHCVTVLDPPELEDLYRLRGLLEVSAYRFQGGDLSSSGIAQLADTLNDLEAASTIGDPVAFSAALRRFHLSLFDERRQPQHVRLLQHLWNLSDLYSADRFADPAARKESITHAKRILKFLTEGDQERVAEELAEQTWLAELPVVTPEDTDRDAGPRWQPTALGSRSPLEPGQELRLDIGPVQARSAVGPSSTIMVATISAAVAGRSGSELLSTDITQAFAISAAEQLAITLIAALTSGWRESERLRLLELRLYMVSGTHGNHDHVLDAASAVFIERLGADGDAVRSSLGVTSLSAGAWLEMQTLFERLPDQSSKEDL